ncbi:hypothetical protein [Gordonia sp. SMJS1]|uniref:hypothetical protein n=1 Tax=Gordonia sp. SMJS1 TaxID=3039400 RepID=UPI002453E750|nr:hypothetical protein [Gordonia sp. SMJS1]WGJ88044.1 hypothetical protein QAD21_24350 [Gordonia sp. SMJS1]
MFARFVDVVAHSLQLAAEAIHQTEGAPQVVIALLFEKRHALRPSGYGGDGEVDVPRANSLCVRRKVVADHSSQHVERDAGLCRHFGELQQLSGSLGLIHT